LTHGNPDARFGLQDGKYGGISLSGPWKKRRLAELSRREFLQYGQCAALALVPSWLNFPRSGLGDSPQRSPQGPELHLHPVYRTPRAVEAVLKKVRAEFDDFPSEVYCDRISGVLAEWSAELKEAPQKWDTLQRVMGTTFGGVSPEEAGITQRREDGMIRVWDVEFKKEPLLGSEAFLAGWRSTLKDFSRLLTVEFQITGVEIEGDPAIVSVGQVTVNTRLRYELVGVGNGFHREQRVGNADLQWTVDAEKKVWLQEWRGVNETRSRASGPILEDMAGQAFGGCASFASQFLKSVDYWRTILDGASGIDIYGHNGVALGDVDGDGFDDLYICQPAGLPNRLYRNRGDGTFEDITEASGVGLLDNTACALFADVSNVGRQDLIVVRTSGPMLFVNQGGGKFRAKPDAFKFANPPRGTFTGAAMADYDRDGWLDIYFCLYAYYQGTDQYKYPMPYYAAENGPPNFMMKNNRDGTFQDVTVETRLNQNNTRFSFCCGWGDANGDGWPDLYVVNDFGRKNLYKNNGDGTFTDIAKEAGVEDVGAGMSASWLDCDNDGRQDLYVADMWTAAGLRVSSQLRFQQWASEEVRALYRRHAMGNCLYRNRGQGEFEEDGARSGTQVGRWAWSSDAWDFNHDGSADIYIANGMVSGPQKQDLNSFFWRQVVAHSPESATPTLAYEQGWNAINELIRADATWSGYERNVLFLNNGDGTFSDVSGITGTDFVEDSRTFVMADFDHDGRVEVVLKNRGGPQLRYLKNVMSSLAPSIAFRLTGKKSNRDAIGALVTIETNIGRQERIVQAGSGFLAQHSKEVFFGLGNAIGTIKATIHWPSGLEQKFEGLPANHRIWVEEDSTTVRKEAFSGTRNAVDAKQNSAAQPESELPVDVETWLLVPVAAPDFQVPGLNGASSSLAALSGKPVLIFFGSPKMPGWEKTLTSFQSAHEKWMKEALQLILVNTGEPQGDIWEGRWSFPVVNAPADLVAVYNLLYGRLFDRHRDMGLPTSFLLDAQGNIAKVYQGVLRLEHVEEDCQHIPSTAAERMARGLPFPGAGDTYEVGRNYLSFGSIFYDRGYLEQAKAFFELAKKEDPSGAGAWYGLGTIFLQQQNTKEARECFERAIHSNADYPTIVPNAWNNLGILAGREGKSDEAIGYFQKALEMSPDHVVALQNLGNAYRQKKDWDDAKRVLEHALTVSPEDAEANYSLGMVYAQLNDTERAYAFLQKALVAKPDFPEALNNLGILYLRTRRPEEAAKSFQESIRVAPNFEPAYFNLARLYAIEGDKDKARTTLEKLLEIHPDQAQAKKELDNLGF
jgi:tetratricopeptide (TPR) repeat protein